MEEISNEIYDEGYSNFFKGLIWGIGLSIPLWVMITVGIRLIIKY